MSKTSNNLYNERKLKIVYNFAHELKEKQKVKKAQKKITTRAFPVVRIKLVEDGPSITLF